MLDDSFGPGGSRWLATTRSSATAWSSTAPGCRAAAATSASSTGASPRLGKIDAADADRVLDADGLIVAPGFVDLHTHYDAQLFWDPYCTLSGWHGVTSVVIGNCGFGFAPVRPDDRERSMRSMTRVEAIPYDSMKAGLPWNWVTYPEFLDRVASQPHVGEPAAVRARRPAARVGARLGARQGGRHADRRRARRDAPAAARGDGRRRRRLVGAAAPPRQRARASSATSTARRWSPTSCTPRRCFAARRGRSPSATTASSRSPTAAPEGEDGHGFIERLAEISGPPGDHGTPCRPSTRCPRCTAGSSRGSQSCRDRGLPGVRPGRHHRRRLHVHLRGLEPLRRERRVVRGHDRHASRSGWPSSPTRRAARRCATRTSTSRSARSRRSSCSAPAPTRRSSGRT